MMGNYHARCGVGEKPEVVTPEAYLSLFTTYSTTIYINGSEKETLLSNGVDDQTGETIDVSGNVGQISGDILRDSDADKLTDNLWFELKTTNLNGEESTYRVQLETTEITKEVKK